MPRGWRGRRRLPTLGVMRPPRYPLLVASTLLIVAAPRAMRAQSNTAGVMASAVVLSRPLSLRTMAWTGVPGELRIQLDGCGSGALTVDARAGASLTRFSRLPLDASGGCGPRAVTVHLPLRTPDAEEYIVTLQHFDALHSAAFAQFALPATAVTRTRTTVGY